MNTPRRAAVGLSGGVDSAVAAAILLEEGYEVLGLTMKIWKGNIAVAEGAKHACFGPGEEEDIAACTRLAAGLGIEYRVLDLADEYEERVLEYFRREYLRGRTPNPCVVCNRELKFGFLVDRARESGLDFDFFATGHYARIEEREGVRYVKRAAFEAKDQSYFIYGLDSERLAGIRFPLGALSKEEVRAKARKLGLETADKPESQDFIAGGDYAPLFADRPPEPGDFVDGSGRTIGRHRGLPYYTVGQRRGLGVSTGPEPLYVLKLEPEANRIVLGPNAGLFAEGLEAADFRLQDPRRAAAPFRAAAKLRQNHRPAPCLVKPAADGACRLEFDVAQRAVAPGQSAVLYDEEGLVLGGGVIERAIERLD
ncbi:MAG: tRNA 2-thiouridine(34) synthase MnmA [Spirochaetaceae bacterium]|nr:tRNA 2-thiouridine(34) synthase MnmA [Spirochaetaceae bacterium]